ncbi:hypothetical protein C8Q78DRAFT_968391 [Trametes maxima]|nr:hypothetical protein C8Q78DRAFT_968391 [Trametes maxima]
MALYQIYREQVERRWKGWQKRRSSQTQYVPQLEWAAHVVEYVNWIHGLVSTKLASGPLRAVVPLLHQQNPQIHLRMYKRLQGRPRFIPPGYLHATRRNLTVDIQPETAYVKALTVIHPLYFPELAKCPRCAATGPAVSWTGWTPSGHREVHGIDREETAIGYQLRCQRCAEGAAGQQATGQDSEANFCFATTNHLFWQAYEHWEIPGEDPASHTIGGAMKLTINMHINKLESPTS